MSLGLAMRQVRFENRSFWRNPAAAFFTVAFPIMFLVIFNLIFGNEKLPNGLSTSTFYVAGISAMSIVSACYTNIAITTTFSREAGILKRIRGTPLPSWAYLFGRVTHATLIGLLLVVVIALFGKVFYDVTLPTTTMPAFIVTVMMGAATFSALGLAVTKVIPNFDAAPAITNVTVLPLLFISDVFISLDAVDAPEFLKTVSKIFPVRPFVDAMLTSFDPRTVGSGFEWGNLAAMAVWAAIGMILAVRYFSWEPRK